jgi:anti-anti-sigma factor
MPPDATKPVTLANEYFQVKRHGDIAVIVPSPEVEQLPESLIQPAAQMVLAPLKEDPPSNLIVDLEGVRYFGSAFITFLLRCHLVVRQQGSELVLAGVNPRIRELLRTTALDTLWALYETRQEALDALGGMD